MNLNLISRGLKERWLSGSIFALSLVLYVWMLISFLPIISKSIQIQKLLAEYPKAIMNLLAGAADVNFFTPEGFFSLEFLALWLPIIVYGFAVTFATAIVAKEIDDGTMDLLLAQPISRTTLVLSRFLVLILYLLALTVVTLGSMRLLAPFYDATFKTSGLLVTSLLFLLFMLAISSCTLFFSVVLKERGRAIITSVSIFIASHLLNALAEFNDTLKELRFLSIFRYYNPYKALSTGEMPWRDLGIFLGITLVFLIASLLIFRRKDISV